MNCQPARNSKQAPLIPGMHPRRIAFAYQRPGNSLSARNRPVWPSISSRLCSGVKSLATMDVAAWRVGVVLSLIASLTLDVRISSSRAN